MKKLLDFFKDEDAIEKIIGGIFGVIAIAAIIIEMSLGNFEPDAVVGGIKDIASTLITVVMLIVAIRALRPKEERLEGFKEVFDVEIEKIKCKYAPILEIKNTDGYDLSIADNLRCLYGGKNNSYSRFCTFNEGDEKITFKASKTVFFGRSEESHTEELFEISTAIATAVKNTYPDFIENIGGDVGSFDLVFKKQLVNENDATLLAKVIDKVLLLYVARCKK